jgi:hypothetical protein
MKLLHAMLSAMVGAPYASLTRRELRRRFADEFEHARLDRLIEELPGAVDYVANDEGWRRRVVVEERGAVLIDEDDPEEEPEIWSLEDVRRWRADPERVIDFLRLRHGLIGEFGVLDPECWLLGDAGRRRVILSLDVELEASAERAREMLAPDNALVVASATIIVPLARTVELKKRGITFAKLTDGLDIEPPLGELDAHAVVFTHADNYESVTMRGQSFVLSPLQAALISILHSAERARTPDLSWAQIRDRLNARNFYPGSMRDIRKRMDGRDELVWSVRRGRYRLRV